MRADARQGGAKMILFTMGLLFGATPRPASAAGDGYDTRIHDYGTLDGIFFSGRYFRFSLRGRAQYFTPNYVSARRFLMMIRPIRQHRRKVGRRSYAA